jgi:hypothetical protein
MLIDHLRENEKIAINLPHPDPDWIWTMRDDAGDILAYLVAVETHGVMFMIELRRVKENAPLIWALLLLRKAMRDCAARGVTSYLTWLADDSEACMEMKRLCEKYGGRPQPMSGSVVAGHVQWFLREEECQQLSL